MSFGNPRGRIEGEKTNSSMLTSNFFLRDPAIDIACTDYDTPGMGPSLSHVRPEGASAPLPAFTRSGQVLSLVVTASKWDGTEKTSPVPIWTH